MKIISGIFSKLFSWFHFNFIFKKRVLSFRANFKTLDEVRVSCTPSQWAGFAKVFDLGGIRSRSCWIALTNIIHLPIVNVISPSPPLISCVRAGDFEIDHFAWIRVHEIE